MSDEYGKYYPSPYFFFKPFDVNPYLYYRGENIKVPLSFDLKGIDLLNLENNKNMFVKVSDDETQLILSNDVDGGEF